MTNRRHHIPDHLSCAIPLARTAQQEFPSRLRRHLSPRDDAPSRNPTSISSRGWSRRATVGAHDLNENEPGNVPVVARSLGKIAFYPIRAIYQFDWAPSPSLLRAEQFAEIISFRVAISSGILHKRGVVSWELEEDKTRRSPSRHQGRQLARRVPGIYGRGVSSRKKHRRRKSSLHHPNNIDRIQCTRF